MSTSNSERCSSHEHTIGGLNARPFFFFFQKRGVRDAGLMDQKLEQNAKGRRYTVPRFCGANVASPHRDRRGQTRVS
jgi:hypothetical protein